METKLKTTTDNIHESIYLSSLEFDLISTPYFYRLHDIYQSSTVYMTYPSNRTKRYEHSLGTMELASRMLYAAVSNADKSTRIELFSRLQESCEEIFNKAIRESHMTTARYFDIRKLAGLFNSKEDITSPAKASDLYYTVMEKCIAKTVSDNLLADAALDHFQYYPLEVTKSELTGKKGISVGQEKEFVEKTVGNYFLYRCLLEAIRIVALFHDIGHPPYSHIVENSIKKIYNELSSNKSKKKFDANKRQEFLKAIGKYAAKKGRDVYKANTICTNCSSKSDELHERISLSFLQSCIDEVIPNRMDKVLQNGQMDSYDKISFILYYVTIVEFAIAILVEKNNTFKSMHKIVDGILDADRLDYIMRDTANSGVDWGRIPYKRVIESAKLFSLPVGENNKKNLVFVIAYPKKTAEDLADILLSRYKIFCRINYHHRCMKTAVALQSCVEKLAYDYLRHSNDDDCINPEIKLLWTSLTDELGEKAYRIIRWNDSWLISTLHKALIAMIVDENGFLQKEDGFIQERKNLKEDLEEILLNKKRYYSLFKRGEDSREFVSKVIEKTGISEEIIEEKIKQENKQVLALDKSDESKEDLMSPVYNAKDSLKRLPALFKTGDLQELNRTFPVKGDLEKTIHKVLDDLKKKRKLADYKVIVNERRGKTGIPNDIHHADNEKADIILDQIYLFNENGCFSYDDTVSLSPQIHEIKRNTPYVYIYIVPDENELNQNLKGLMDEVIDELSTALGNEIKKSFSEMFPNTLGG